jgi:hypothetical protein
VANPNASIVAYSLPPWNSTAAGKGTCATVSGPSSPTLEILPPNSSAT